MGCFASRHSIDMSSIRIDNPLKRKLPMYFETPSQKILNINQSTDPIQVSNEISSNETDQKNINSEETVLLIKHEIDNTLADGNFVSYGSHTLTDICLKNPHQQTRTCESIMIRVDKLRL
jgi:hypothetical protein